MHSMDFFSYTIEIIQNSYVFPPNQMGPKISLKHRIDKMEYKIHYSIRSRI